MLIYIFLEHYPNPYKPYIDTQLIYLASSKHTIRIIAGDKYESAINADIEKHSLIEKTEYYPNTLKDLPKFFSKILRSLLAHPVRGIRTLALSYKWSNSIKSFKMRSARMLLLPVETPDLCLLHNLTTVRSFPFLQTFYKGSEIILYYHGGELPRQVKIKDADDLFLQVNRIFTNTNASKQAAVDRGCNPDSIHISPVGFNIDDFPIDKNKLFKQNDVVRFVSIGRLSEEKGYIYALQAFNLLKIDGHKNIHYSIIGAGYLRDELQQYIDDNNLSGNVTLVGEKNKHEVIEILNNSDVLILPSIALKNCAETQACVVQEAMLMGLPVITTTIGGVPESIPDELKTLSIAPNDPKALANMIQVVTALDNKQLQKYGMIGRKFVESNYNIDMVTRKILNTVN